MVAGRAQRYRHPFRVSRVVVVAVAAVVALSAGLLSLPLASADEPRAAADASLRYVALGDSSASGPLIPNQIDAACLRSDRNWPRVLASTLGAELTDVTCSGARVPDLAGRQSSSIRPQFDAFGEDVELRRDIDLVTLAIGGNDIGGNQAFVTCATLTPQPTGPTCEERHTVDGVDQLAARIAATAPALGAALDQIHTLAPQATVLVVGYLTYWQPGGCFPADYYTPADADYLQATFDRLMDMLDQQATSHDATYVDIRTPSAGHGLCAPPAERWLEGAVPASPAYPYHPNAAGMANAARIIAAEVPRS